MKTLFALVLGIGALLLPPVQGPIFAATRTWDGSVSGLWSAAGNWAENAVPANGDALVFPDGPTRVLTTNSPGGATNFTSITLTGPGYSLLSVPLSITNGLTNTVGLLNTTNTIRAIVLPRAAQTWTTGGRTMLVLESNVAYTSLTLTLNQAGTIEARGNVGGAGAGLTKIGNGRLVLNGPNNTFSQARAGDGTFEVNGSVVASSLVVSNGAVLAGEGTVSPFSCAGDVRIGASAGSDVGVLTVSSGTAVFLPGGVLQAKLFGAAPGSGYDQLRVSSPPTLTDCGLRLVRTPGVPMTLGQKFVIITNTGAAVFTTSFQNLPPGALITNSLAPATVFQISYSGGSGNDVELTVVSVAVSPTGNAAVWDGDAQPNREWTNALNWSANALPAPGDSLVFPASVPATRRSTIHSATNNPTFNRLFFGDVTGDLWSVSGREMRLIGGIVATSPPSGPAGGAIVSPSWIELTGPQTFAATNAGLRVGSVALAGNTLTVAPATGADISLAGSLGGPGLLVKTGGGNVAISAESSDPIPVTMSAGTTRLLDGRFTGSGTWLLNGGRLELRGGTVPRISVNAGTLAVAPDADLRSTNSVPGDVILGSSSVFEATLGASVDKFGNAVALLHVAGGVTLSNAALSVAAPGLAFVGSTFIVVQQPGTNAFRGTFAGRPEGAVFEALNPDGFTLPLRISYVGGDGNDLTLTVLKPVPSGVSRDWSGLGADGFWTTVGNWEAGALPGVGDSVRFPADAARRTNENNLPVVLDSITWLGADYVQQGSTALLGGLRAGHAAGTNDLNGLIVAIGAQTWAVSNAAAALRLGLLGANAVETDRASLLLLGPVTKTGPGALELSGVGISMTDNLVVDGGTLRLRRTAGAGNAVTNGHLRLHQGVVDAAESSFREFIATAGELIVRLRTEDGVLSRSGLSASGITLAPGVICTVVDTNRTLRSPALNSQSLTIDGARLNALLPPGLARGTRIVVASYELDLVGAGFAGLPEGAVTNYSGNFVQIRYAEILPDSEVRSVTLTVVAGAPPRFTGFVRVNPTTLVLQGRGPAGELITLEGSTDFVTWAPLGSTLAGADEFGFVVNPTTPEFRFFRLSAP